MLTAASTTQAAPLQLVFTADEEVGCLGAQKLAEEARDRVRFEEEALELADQVYRVARRLVSTREEAEDLMQETYSRAFRAWRSYQPGTNLRAWLLRILTNLNIDRGRRQQLWLITITDQNDRVVASGRSKRPASTTSRGARARAGWNVCLVSGEMSVGKSYRMVG